MRVAFRVDASPVIGGGHAMRCLTLANALAQRDAQATFISAAMPIAIRQRILDAGHDFVSIRASPELDREGPGWEVPVISPAAQLQDAAASAQAAPGGFDWLVVDHYLLDATWQREARMFADRILVIDDMANRAFDCDLLVDQTLGRSAWDYQAMAPPETRILTSPVYALLRPEFAAARRAALNRRRQVREPTRILLSMGTTDPNGMSIAIGQAIAKAMPGCDVDVVLGPQADPPALELPLAHGERVRVHNGSDHMAELMLDADLAVGGAGTTSWERCCLGLPTVTIALSDNQRMGSQALSEAGAALVIDSADDVVAAVITIAQDRHRLAAMSAAAFAITDGLGTARVAAAMFPPAEPLGSVCLRPALVDDAELLWLWRNDLTTRKQSRNQEPIPWDDHARWLASTLADADRRIMITEVDGRAVGTVRLDATATNTYEISITTAPDRRGRGLGAQALQAACARYPGATLTATVQTDNEASRNLFENCGFRPTTSIMQAYLRYSLAPNERSSD